MCNVINKWRNGNQQHGNNGVNGVMQLKSMWRRPAAISSNKGNRRKSSSMMARVASINRHRGYREMAAKHQQIMSAISSSAINGGNGGVIGWRSKHQRNGGISVI